MKKIKFMQLIVFTLCFVFVFSGCSIVDFFAADTLLRAPKLTGENAALQKAVEEAVGVDISLFTPISGDYKSSYVLFDHNNDKIDEAVVFYAYNSNPSVIHMNLLTKIDDEWCSVSDVTGSGTGVYKVDFFNIDNQSGLEIAVTWLIDDIRREKMLSVYKVFSLVGGVDNAVSSVATIQLADYVYLDIDSDAVNELLYFFNSDTDNSYLLSARVLDYDSEEKSFIPMSEVKLSQSISSFEDIKFEKSGNNFVFYIDCEANDQYFTEIMVYDYEKSAVSIESFNGQPFSEITFKQFSLNCVDFNDDGLLDIPCMLDSEDSYISAQDTEHSPLSFVRWMNFKDGKFIEVSKSFVNNFDGYYFDISDLYEYYYLVYDMTNKTLQVRLKNSDPVNNLIFSVSFIKSDDSYSHLLPDLTDSDYEIVISAQGEAMNFTKSFIRSLITEI